MGYMRMRIEPNIIEICGGSFGYLANKSILFVWGNFGRFQIPGVHVFVATLERYGNIQWFGQVYFVVAGVVFYRGYQIWLFFIKSQVIGNQFYFIASCQNRTDNLLF